MNQQRRVEYIVFTEEGAGKWTSENCNIENSTGDRKEHGQTGPGKASGKMDVLVPSKETNLAIFGICAAKFTLKVIFLGKVPKIWKN